MTIKKQWIFVLILISILAIGINSTLFSILINKQFADYLEEGYKENIIEIQEYAQYVLSNDHISTGQLRLEMQKYLDDPITSIDIYDNNFKVKASVSDDTGGGHGNMMMRMNWAKEGDSYDILEDNGEIIGTLVITRLGTVRNSFITLEFKNTLFINSLLSGIIVLIIAMIVSIAISKKTSKSLMDTATYARALDDQEEIDIKETNIKEVKEIQQSLKLLFTKLKLKEKGRKQKIDEIAHKCRTPLAILKSHVEGSIDGVVRLDKARLENCLYQIDNLTNTISGLNNIIELKQEEKPLNIQKFDVVLLCRKIIKGLRMQFDEKTISLKIKGIEKGFITTDEYLLSEVIYNLLNNAYKYSPPGGKVALYIGEEKEKYIIISIRDNGIGIPKENIPNIFDAYYRSNNIGEVKGQGLGLFLVKNNIDRINGEITVESEINKGSTFTLKLPIVQ